MEAFWQLTPGEVWEVIKADWWRHDRWGQTLAVFFAPLINAHPIKRRVRPRDLWRLRLPDEAPAKSRDEHQREFEQLVKLMGPQAIPVRLPPKGKGVA
ncbi:MAG TPA: hypothetical protein VIK99_03455 [Thermaerobacter sp.]